MRLVSSAASSLVLVALTAAATALAGPPAKSKAPTLTAELAAKGRATYQTSCTVCHGDGGAGDGMTGKYLNPPPRNFAREPFKQGDSVDAIFATLQTGVPGTPMVAFPQLSEDDRWAVAWYVAHFRDTKEGKKAKKIVDALPPLTSTTSITPAASVPAAPASPAPTTP
jgi:high-affinity iron transporter